MADFQVMGGTPDFYTQLMSAARQQLVRQPDGTYAPAPQFGGSTSLDDIYEGILPSPRQALTSRSVPTYDVDTAGMPIVPQKPGFVADTAAATRAEQSGSRPAITAGSQPAGTVAMPPGARPASVDRAFAQMGIQPLPQMMGRGQPLQTAQAPTPLPRPMGNTVWDPFGTSSVAKDESRLPTNAGEQEFMDAFYPQAENPAVGAIDSAVVPLPRQRPLPPAQIPLKTALAPMPRQRPASPTGGSYTIQKGDTLSSISARTGISVPDLAVMNNISDPNRITAGQKLKINGFVPTGENLPGAKRADGSPVQIMRKAGTTPLPGRRVATPLPKPRETRAERFTNLDQFGNII